MIRVILIRPGMTDFDEQGRIKGTLDVPLNEYGTDQIVRTANELADQSIEVVYTAPCQAAEETANVLSTSLGVKSRPMRRLHNLNHGLWQGKLIDEVRATQRKVYRQWQEQPETVCPPEGEMLGAARRRVRMALEKILRRHKQGVVALVVPEPLASLVRSELDRSELGDLWRAETRCGSWEYIDVHSQQLA
jgi:probable phosphoglycerate mutase